MPELPGFNRRTKEMKFSDIEKFKYIATIPTGMVLGAWTNHPTNVYIDLSTGICYQVCNGKYRVNDLYSNNTTWTDLI